MSELLQINLFQFIMTEHLLQMAALKTGSKESLLFKIQAAVKINDSSLMICSIIMKEIKKDKGDREADKYVRSNKNNDNAL